MSLPVLYRDQEEKLAAVKKRLFALLPRQTMNQYFLERAKTEIEQSGYFFLKEKVSKKNFKLASQLLQYQSFPTATIVCLYLRAE